MLEGVRACCVADVGGCACVRACVCSCRLCSVCSSTAVPSVRAVVAVAVAAAAAAAAAAAVECVGQQQVPHTVVSRRRRCRCRLRLLCPPP